MSEIGEKIIEDIKKIGHKPRELVEYLRKHKDIIKDLGLDDRKKIGKVITKTLVDLSPFVALAELQAMDIVPYYTTPISEFLLPLTVSFLGLNLIHEIDKENKNKKLGQVI